jgi:hypothetical protein
VNDASDSPVTLFARAARQYCSIIDALDRLISKPATVRDCDRAQFLLSCEYAMADVLQATTGLRREFACETPAAYVGEIDTWCACCAVDLLLEPYGPYWVVEEPLAADQPMPMGRELYNDLGLLDFFMREGLSIERLNCGNAAAQYWSQWSTIWGDALTNALPVVRRLRRQLESRLAR